MRLTYKMGLGAISCGALIFALGLLCARLAEHELHESLVEVSQTLADSLMGEIDRALMDHSVTWRAYGCSPVIRDCLRRQNRWWDARGDRLLQLQQIDQDWRDHEGSAEDGPWQAVLASAESRELRERIEDYHRLLGQGIYAEVLITDRHGGLIAASSRPSDFYQADEEWWARGYSEGLAFLSVRRDDSTGKVGVPVCIRIDGEGGETLGVMKVVLDLDCLRKLLDLHSEELSSSERFVLVDAEGKILHATHCSWTSQLVAQLHHRESAHEHEDGNCLLRTRDGGHVAVLSSDAPSGCVTHHSESVLKVVFQKDVASTFASIENLKAAMMVAASTFTAGILIIWVVLGLSFTQRLKNLAKAVARVGAGEKGVRVGEMGGDEVGMLARDVEAMATEIEMLTGRLERRTTSLELQHRKLQAEAEERSRLQKEQEEMQLALNNAQKLEAIGQLAAGIAHEINTPTQYVGDNTHFLRDSFEEICQVLAAARCICECFEDEEARAAALEHLVFTAREVDVEYLQEEIPAALQQSLDGVERISSIVRAMKAFSHPGGSEMQEADLNAALRTTVTVSRNEWKYVSDVHYDLAPDLPLVPCLPGEINQVLLNLVINAAHAIADRVGGHTGDKGTITVHTRLGDGCAEIGVQDDGTGIPEANRERIFDMFFTTKTVGRGTGQGLALAHAVITKKHGGRIWFETEEGVGSTFWVALPLESVASSPLELQP